MNSTNIKVMSEEIQHLKDEVHNLDVEIPSHDSGDAGKYLGVDSSGDLEFSDPFPAKTEAATGDVLGLTGEGKVPGWITPYTPKDYSETEQNTGVKWIDGKDIYSITFSGTLDSTIANTVNNFVFDSIISAFGFFKSNVNSQYYDFNRSVLWVGASGKNGIYYTTPTTGTLVNADYQYGFYYTKPDPVPGNREPDQEPETKKVTRKKSTK